MVELLASWTTLRLPGQQDYIRNQREYEEGREEEGEEREGKE